MKVSRRTENSELAARSLPLPGTASGPRKREQGARRADREPHDQWGTSLYEVLQVSPTARPEVVRAAYAVLARRYIENSGDPKSPRPIAAIQAAYRILSDPECRADYDAARKATIDGLGSASNLRKYREQRTGIRQSAFAQWGIDPSRPNPQTWGAQILLLAAALSVFVVFGLIAYALTE
jgi:hypothetical protein